MRHTGRMTTTELDQLDQERPGLDTRVYIRDAQRWWVAALGGFLVGVLAVVVVTVGRPKVAEPVPPPVPPSALLRFEIGGDGQIDYMATIHAGWVETTSTPTVQVSPPSAAIMTVRAQVGQDRVVVCQLFVDGVMKVQQQATDGGSATCVWVTHE